MFFSSSARHRPGDRSVSSLGVHIRPAIASLTLPCTAGKKNNRRLTAGIRPFGSLVPFLYGDFKFYSSGVAMN